jgi:hypothetical protein
MGSNPVHECLPAMALSLEIHHGRRALDVKIPADRRVAAPGPHLHLHLTTSPSFQIVRRAAHQLLAAAGMLAATQQSSQMTVSVPP